MHLQVEFTRVNKKPLTEISNELRTKAEIEERIVWLLESVGYLQTKHIRELFFAHSGSYNSKKSQASKMLTKLETEKRIKSKYYDREKIYYFGKTPLPRSHDLAIRDLLVKILKSDYQILEIKLSANLGDLLPDLIVNFLAEDGSIIQTIWELDAGTERNRELESKVERYYAHQSDYLITFVFMTKSRLDSFLKRVHSGYVRFAVLEEFSTLADPAFLYSNNVAESGKTKTQQSFFT